MASQEREMALDAAMLDIQGRAGRFGAPSLTDGVLSFGTTAIPKPDYEIVTQVQSDFGCHASIFVAKGDGFVCATTNLFRDHHRALNTDLDPTGPVIGPIKAGVSYRGPADILGEAHDTYYEPIFDSDGAVIGAFLVAFIPEA